MTDSKHLPGYYLECTNYSELYGYVVENYPTKQNEYGSIQAVYAPSNEDLKIIQRMFQVGHSTCGYYIPKYSELKWHGPDWYFDNYEPGDQNGPGYAYLSSLIDKWEAIEKLTRELTMLKFNFYKERE